MRVRSKNGWWDDDGGDCGAAKRCTRSWTAECTGECMANGRSGNRQSYGAPRAMRVAEEGGGGVEGGDVGQKVFAKTSKR